MSHCTLFAEPTLPCQSFGRPFNPAASLWHWFVSSWEQQVFIGLGISRILVVTCLTFNSEIPAKAASSLSLTAAINLKLRSAVWLLTLPHKVYSERLCGILLAVSLEWFEHRYILYKNTSFLRNRRGIESLH